MNTFLMWLARRHPFAAMVLAGGFREEAADKYLRYIAANREDKR